VSTVGEVALAVGGAVLGWLLSYVSGKVQGHYQFKKELKDNNHVDVNGEWYVAWQTSVDGQQLLNTEHIMIVQRGQTIRMWNTEKSPENPKGGYLWEAQLQFFQGRNVMGWFFAKKEESNTSKGIMYFSYFSPRKIFWGSWVGSAYDGELVSGYAVIGKDRTTALQELTSFIQKHPSDVRLISYAGLSK